MAVKLIVVMRHKEVVFPASAWLIAFTQSQNIAHFLREPRF
jgi:hypothetical protein